MPFKYHETPKSSKIIALYNFTLQNRQLDFDRDHTNPWFVIESLELYVCNYNDLIIYPRETMLH